MLEEVVQKQLGLDLNEEELDKKLKALTHADIILQGQTNARYHSVKDNLFDKVFRGAYQEDIDDLLHQQIHSEHQALTEKAKKNFQKE